MRLLRTVCALFVSLFGKAFPYFYCTDLLTVPSRSGVREDKEAEVLRWVIAIGESLLTW